MYARQRFIEKKSNGRVYILKWNFCEEQVIFIRIRRRHTIVPHRLPVVGCIESFCLWIWHFFVRVCLNCSWWRSSTLGNSTPAGNKPNFQQKKLMREIELICWQIRYYRFVWILSYAKKKEVTSARSPILHSCTF